MSTSTSQPSSVANPVASLTQFGQSVWLDYIRRSLIAGGELKRLVDEDGARRRDLEPRDLREGHRRQQRLRGAIEEISEDPASRRQGGLRAAGRQGHPGRRRRPAAASTTGPRRTTAT